MSGRPTRRKPAVTPTVPDKSPDGASDAADSSGDEAPTRNLHAKTSPVSTSNAAAATSHEESPALSSADIEGHSDGGPARRGKNVRITSPPDARARKQAAHLGDNSDSFFAGYDTASSHSDSCASSSDGSYTKGRRSRLGRSDKFSLSVEEALMIKFYDMHQRATAHIRPSYMLTDAEPASIRHFLMVQYPGACDSYGKHLKPTALIQDNVLQIIKRKHKDFSIDMPVSDQVQILRVKGMYTERYDHVIAEELPNYYPAHTFDQAHEQFEKLLDKARKVDMFLEYPKEVTDTKRIALFWNTVFKDEATRLHLQYKATRHMERIGAKLCDVNFSDLAEFCMAYSYEHRKRFNHVEVGKYLLASGKVKVGTREDSTSPFASGRGPSHFHRGRSSFRGKRWGDRNFKNNRSHTPQHHNNSSTHDNTAYSSSNDKSHNYASGGHSSNNNDSSSHRGGRGGSHFRRHNNNNRGGGGSAPHNSNTAPTTSNAASGGNPRPAAPNAFTQRPSTAGGSTGHNNVSNSNAQGSSSNSGGRSSSNNNHGSKQTNEKTGIGAVQVTQVDDNTCVALVDSESTAATATLTTTLKDVQVATAAVDTAQHPFHAPPIHFAFQVDHVVGKAFFDTGASISIMSPKFLQAIPASAKQECTDPAVTKRYTLSDIAGRQLPTGKIYTVCIQVMLPLMTSNFSQPIWYDAQQKIMVMEGNLLDDYDLVVGLPYIKATGDPEHDKRYFTIELFNKLNSGHFTIDYKKSANIKLGKLQPTHTVLSCLKLGEESSYDDAPILPGNPGDTVKESDLDHWAINPANTKAMLVTHTAQEAAKAIGFFMGDEAPDEATKQQAEAIVNEAMAYLPKDARIVAALVALKTPIAMLGRTFPTPDVSVMTPYVPKFIKGVTVDQIPLQRRGLTAQPKPGGKGYPEYEETMDRLIALNLIVEGGNPKTHHYPLHFMTQSKPGAKYRMVVDMTYLNAFIEKEPQYLPDVKLTQDSFKNCIVFSLFDEKSSFHHRPIHPDYQIFFGVMYKGKYYVWTVTPFGVSELPIYMQRWVQEAYAPLTKYTHTKHRSHIDDNMMGTVAKDNKRVPLDSPEGMEAVLNHLEFVRAFLEIAVENNRRFSLDKIQLCKPSIQAVGFINDGDTIAPAQKHRDPFQHVVPANLQNVNALRVFLGMGNWLRDFIADFAGKVEPLQRLLTEYLTLKKPIKNNWTPACTEAVQTIVEDVKNLTALYLVDVTQPLYIRSDASILSHASVAFQYDPDTGRPRVLAFHSGMFSRTQQGYSIALKEYYACLVTVRAKRSWVLACPKTILQGDHLNNTYQDVDNKNHMLTRWKIELAHYSAEVQHIPGETNVVADALSRIYPSATKLYVHKPADPTTPLVAAAAILTSTKGTHSHSHVSSPSPLVEDIAAAQASAPAEELEIWKGNKFRSVQLSDTVAVVMRGQAMVIPASQSKIKADLLKACHDACLHGGITDTMHRLRDAKVWWVRMQEEVSQYIASCSNCQITKSSKHPTNHGTMQLAPAPLHPFEYICCDLIGPIDGVSLMLMVCVFTRYAELVVLADATSASTAKAFYRHILLRHGYPSTVHTDGGSHFAKDFTEMLAAHHIQHTVASPHHHASAGMAERAVGTVLAKMRAAAHSSLLADGVTGHLDDIAAHAIFAYNTAYNRDISMSPFQAYHGNPARSPAQAALRNYATAPLTISELAEYIEAIQFCVRYASAVAAVSSKAAFDIKHTPLVLEVGDQVLVYYPPSTPGSHKLGSCYRGPYKVVGKDGDNFYHVAFILGDGTTEKPERLHAERLKKFNSSRTSDLEAVQYQLPTGHYIVEKILKHSFTNPFTRKQLPDDGAYFLVKWKGYDNPKDCTWEPREELIHNEKYLEYIAAHQQEFTAQGVRRHRNYTRGNRTSASNSK